MRRIILFSALLLLTFGVQSLYAFATKGQDCSKCHTIKKEEAAAVLKKFDQNMKVLNVGKSPVKYLWQVSYELDGKKGIAYLDLPKKHLFSGSLFEVQGKQNLTEDSLSELNRVNVSQIPLKDALLLGAKNAKHKVIVFDDPE